MLDNSVIIALFSLIGTALGTFGGIRASNKLMNYQIQELKNEMSELKKKVGEHNNFNVRLGQMEQRCQLVTCDINKDIQRVEKKVDEIARTAVGA